MWMLLLVIAFALLYYWLKKTYSYWDKKGIIGPKPAYFVGNVGASFIGKKSLGEIIREIYRQYEDHAFVGIYRTSTPCLVIRDPEMYKNIAVKDFASFHDNETVVDKNADPVFGRNPFVLKGSEWKEKRQHLSQNFTTGKIKKMYPIVTEVAQRMMRYLEQEIKDKPTIESRELCVRFTLDIIATCAFAIEGKCFDEAYPEFRRLADKFINPGNWESFKLFLALAIPQIVNFVSLRFISKEVEEALFAIVKQSMAHREKNNIIRHDFLDGIQQLRKTTAFEDVDVVAHAASFFVDGYETSSRVMSYLLFDLALNPEAQVKLREELVEYYDKNNGEFTYDSIHEMPYLDACYNESLRKNNVVHFLAKVCTKQYNYEPTSSEYKDGPVVIEKDTVIIVPISGFHTDPKYFDEPDKYKPERFLDKDNIKKYTFMPFGEGPRACLGQRFATTQIKAGVAYIIKNFELKHNSKTKLPLKFDPWYILNVPIGGLWMDVKKIEN